MQISISFDTSVDTKDAVMNVVAATFGAPIVEYSSDTTTQPEILVPAVINDIGMTGQVHNIATDANGVAFDPAIHQTAAQSTAAVTTDFEVDSTGVPWDERIHQGGNDRQTKDGVWKRKRGVSPVTRQAVEAELMAKLPAMGTPANRVGIPEGGVLGGETPSPDEQLAWVNNTKMEPPALEPLPDYTEPAPRNVDPAMTTIISRDDINAALASAQQVQADVAGAQQAAAMAEAVHEQERARREAEAQQAQAMAQQAADAIAQAHAAQQAQQTPGRFAALMASTSSEELTTVIANEVSAVIGQQLLRLDDLAAIARELTGDEDAGASSFFSLIPLQGYVPRLVALLDQQLANS